MYLPENVKEQKLHVSEPTMSPTKLFEDLLDSVKSSNLNYHIQQTPFAAFISIKKSLIKDKFGNQLKPTHSLDSKPRTCLEAENHALCDKLFHLEKYANTIKNELEDAVSDNANAHNEIRKLEHELDVVSEAFEGKFSDKIKEIESLTLVNDRLKVEIRGAEKSVNKSREDHEELSNLVAHQKKESTKKEKAFNKMKAKKEELENLVMNMENLNVELQTKVKSSETKVLELEANFFSTNISTESQSDCPHQACFLRQPSNPPPPPPGQKIFHVAPPSNIRLLPRTVPSYQAFRSLQSGHECEECEKGALYNNYYEMVHYPDPGPCGGTSGSPVVTCPNNPSASLKVLMNNLDERKKVLRRNICCKLCEKKFMTKENLSFHMKRIHIKRT
jgi:hypothetical protein